MMESMGRRVSSPTLVGRAEELAELDQLVTLASSGEPGLILIGGDAGAGKSRLVAALGERAEAAGVRVLVGHCVDLGDSSLAFSPVAEALRALVRSVEPHRLPDLLGPARRELAALVPGLVDGFRPEPSASASASARWGPLFSALMDAFERLSRDRPVLLVFEDVHWADQATLDLLRAAARGFRSEQILLAATFRSDELHRRHRLFPVLGELARVPNVSRYDLAPFGRREVAEQLAGLLGGEPDAHTVDDILERSGGNAFYVEELAAAHVAGEGLPQALHDTIASRLERLPEQARRTLAAVAVAGQRVSEGLVDILSEGADRRRGDRLRPLTQQHVLVPHEDGGWTFRHSLVREVVLGDLLPGELRGLHARVARALEARPDLAATGAERVQAELAYHWHEARDFDRAVAASVAAAEHAEQLGAFTEALEHYERALTARDGGGLADPARGAVTAGELDPGETTPGKTAPSEVELLQAASKMAYLAGRFRRAATHLSAVLDRVGTALDAESEAVLLRWLAVALTRSGKLGDGLATAERAQALLADRPDSTVKAGVAGTYASILLLAPGDPRAALPPARAALAAATEAEDRMLECRVTAILGQALARSGETEEGVVLLRRAIDLSREIGSPHATISAYLNLAQVLYADDLARGRDRSTELTERVMTWLDTGDERWPLIPLLLWWPIQNFLRHGQWGRAENAIARMGRHHLEGLNQLSLYVLRGTLAWMQGRFDEARLDVRAARRVGLGPRRHHYFFPLEAELAAEEGRLDDVRIVVEEHRRFNVHEAEEAARLATLRALVRAEVDASSATSGATRDAHRARAEATVAEMAEILHRFPPGRDVSLQLELPETYLALAHAELSRAGFPAPDLWRTVLDTAAHAYWRLYARWRLAEALVAVGDEGEATDVLGVLLAETRERGAGHLRRMGEQLARSSRLLLPGMTATDPRDLGLTRREGEVLVLVAAGLSNREIGAALHVTEKTASVHLSNIYTKLEVHDRHAAVARARELGLPGVGASETGSPVSP
jgi:DNA-binding CsgD family transcriptional regulator/tetratricopeptide (TPR) repeat protein